MSLMMFEPRTSRRPCEYYDQWATEPHGRPVAISPFLIRSVPESARNHARTDETVPLLLAARARTHTGHHCQRLTSGVLRWMTQVNTWWMANMKFNPCDRQQLMMTFHDNNIHNDDSKWYLVYWNVYKIYFKHNQWHDSWESTNLFLNACTRKD